MTQLGTVSGTVFGPDGQTPLGGISVGWGAVSGDGGYETSTAADGTFSFKMRPGSLTLNFVTDEYNKTHDPDLRSEWYDNAANFPSATPIYIVAGGETKVEIVLGRLRNQVPVAGSVSIAPETAVAGTVTFTATPAGFSDGDGDALTYHYAWTLNDFKVGTDASTLSDVVVVKGDVMAVSVTASDGTDTSTAAAATLTVTAIAPSLLAHADDYKTVVGQPLKVPAAIGVLANDTYAAGTTLAVSQVNGVIVKKAGVGVKTEHGSVTIRPDGSFTYTPARGYRGTDTFTYVASDGNLASAGTVTLTVAASPMAFNDSYSLARNTTLTISAPGVLANDSKGDGDALTVVQVGGQASQVGQWVRTPHGTVTLNADGSFSYSPTANYRGGDSFSYVVSDGVGTGNTATVKVNVK